MFSQVINRLVGSDALEGVEISLFVFSHGFVSFPPSSVGSWAMSCKFPDNFRVHKAAVLLVDGSGSKPRTQALSSRNRTGLSWRLGDLRYRANSVLVLALCFLLICPN